MDRARDSASPSRQQGSDLNDQARGTLDHSGSVIQNDPSQAGFDGDQQPSHPIVDGLAQDQQKEGGEQRESSRDRKDSKRSKERKSSKDRKRSKDRKSSRDRKDKDRKSSRDRRSSRDRKSSKDRKDRKEKDAKSRKDTRNDSRDRKDRRDSRDRKKRRDKSEEKRKRRSKSRDDSKSKDRRKSRRSNSGSPDVPLRKRSPVAGGRGRFQFDSPPKSQMPSMPLRENPVYQQPPQQQYQQMMMNDMQNNFRHQFQVTTQQPRQQNDQASKSDRKLYIGNILPGLPPQETMAMLNAALKQMNVNTEIPGDSVINIWISPEGHFGFAEFRSAEDTTRAMAALGQVAFRGQQLKVGRPTQYVNKSSSVDYSAPRMSIQVPQNQSSDFNVAALFGGAQQQQIQQQGGYDQQRY